jgi:tetratricopeptide (TPR) repeat protein
MTGKCGGLERAAGRLVLCVLLGSVLFMLWGCEVGPKPSPPAPIMPATSDPTEAQLLAELQEKFENPQAHYKLARVYHKAQNWNKAEYYYNNALGFDPANRAAQAGLVKLFIDRGETAKAEQYANSFILQAARASVRETLRLGWEFRQLNLDDYALRCFRQALDADPNSFEANKQIGFYYRDKGDTAKAKQYLLKSFELNPRQPEVAGALGKLGVVVQLPPEPAAPAPTKPK